MADKKKIRELLNETLQAYHPFYREDVLKWQREFDIPDNWFALNAVRAVEPNTFKVEEFHHQAPYASIKRQTERYDALVEARCLEIDRCGLYRLTEKGRDVIEGFFRVAHVGMAKTEPLAEDELNQLRSLLERLVEATLNAPKPAEKPVLQDSRWTEPGPDVAPSIAIDQLVTDLSRFRDDAHLAAWRPLGVDGRSWEALTYIWQEEASSAADLVEQLAFRGYSEEQYAESLLDLSERGWIGGDEGSYQVTEDGRRIREQAERNTDRLYYAPWSVLDDEELDQLEDLLQSTINNLNKMAMERFWPLAVEVAQAIFPVTRDVVQPAFQEHFKDASIFFPSLMAIGSEPESLSAQLHGQRFPYNSGDQIELRFKAGVEEGILTSTGNGKYRVTAAGKTAVTAVNNIFYTELGQSDPLADGEAAELADLLHRIVEASLEAEEPQDKWAINNMHNCHPEKEYQPLARIDQYLDDLNAFRDDTHNAAWQASEIDGRTREAMTFIWLGDANSADELAEKLAFRGYSKDDYAHSLTELEEKSWAVKGQEGYQITAAGKEYRQGIEETTNRLFYAPWRSLDGGEQFRLRDLLILLKLGLKALGDSEGS